MSPIAVDPLTQQYLEGASPIAPPPPPIKVGGLFVNYDWLTGLANASQQLFPVPAYSDLTIRNRRMVNVSNRLTRINVSLSTQLQSQVTVELEDPSFRLLNSGIFQGQPDVNYKGLRLELAGVATINRGRGALSLKARSQLVQKLKRRRGPLTVVGDERSFIGYECAQVGLPFVTVPVTDLTPGPSLARRVSRDWQPYAQANVTDYDDIPSTWTTFKRLADQRGWMLFEANNVMYFGPPSWLFTNASMVKVRYAPTSSARQEKWKQTRRDQRTNAVVVDPASGGQYWRSLVASGDFDPGVIDVLEVPVFDHSSDRIETTVSFTIEVKDVLHFLPGKVIDFHGVPYFDGLYLCMSVNYDLTGPTATITAQTPVDPQPQGGSTFAGFGGAGRAATSTTGVDLSGSGSDQLRLPVCGITLPSFLRGLRKVESGNYKAPPATSDGASGAYQYEGSTWRSLVGSAGAVKYPQAYLAPAALQDQVAETEVRSALQTYDDDWGKVAAHHIYPATAGHPHLWKYRPFQEPGASLPYPGYDPTSNPRVIDYVRNVLKAAGGVICPRATGGWKATLISSDFVAAALSQVGKPYHQTTAINYETTANPATYDCSSLVQWSAAQVGVTDMPRTSWEQWAHCASNEIDVASALTMRGALLFVDGDGHGEGGAHVAISMGDGKHDLAAHTDQVPLAQQISVAATSPSYWSRAALIPGMTYAPPKAH